MRRLLIRLLETLSHAFCVRFIARTIRAQVQRVRGNQIMNDSRNNSFPWATALALILALGTGPANGAGPDPGVNVNVTNTPANPVPVTGSVTVANTAPIPVTIVSAAAPAEVICHFGIGNHGGTSFSWFSGGGNGGLLCTGGVQGVNARRVIFDPDPPTNSDNFSSIQVMLGLTRILGFPATMVDATTIIGMFSTGDLDKALPQPIRISNSDTNLIFKGSCGGIAGAATKCGGIIWFIGPPI
jgi:hypothetical protein